MPSRRNSIFAVKWILCLNIPNTNFHLSSVQLNCSVSSYHNLYVKFKFITLSLDRVFSISIYKGIYNLLKFIHAWLIGIFLAESLLFQVLTSWFFFFFYFSFCLNELFGLYPDTNKSTENCRWSPCLFIISIFYSLLNKVLLPSRGTQQMLLN